MDFLDFVPVIGDCYRAGKIGYKIGEWIGKNNAIDALLNSMADAFCRCSEAEDGETALDALKELHDIGKQFPGGKKKYQDAIYYSLLVGELYLSASFHWRAAKEESDASIYDTEGLYQLAKKACSMVRSINKTWFTNKRAAIDDARDFTNKMEELIEEDLKLYKEACEEHKRDFNKFLKSEFPSLK